MSDRSQFPLAGTSIELVPTGRLGLPSFSTSYPRIVRADLMAPAAKAAMEAVWHKRVFEPRSLEVFAIKDAFVVDEGLVFDKNLQFVTNSFNTHSQSEHLRALDDIFHAFEFHPPPTYPGTTIVAKKRAPNNYGHFLLEMLPLAFIGRHIFADRNPSYLVHRVSPQTEDTMLRAFRLLGFKLDSLVFADYRQPLRFNELIFFRGLTEHGSYLSPLAVQVAEALAPLVPEGKQRRLFVRRVPGWQQGRNLLNEDAVGARLATKGYDCVEPGSMTLEQQISTFRGADRVIGVAGAAMTNIVFCKPGTRVTLLMPAAFPDTFFWFIAAHKRLDYAELRGEQKTYEGSESWKAGFSVQEGDLDCLE